MQIKGEEVRKTQAALAEAEARIARLESALAPFALMGEWFASSNAERHEPIYQVLGAKTNVIITVGDLVEAARVAAEEHGQ